MINNIAATFLVAFFVFSCSENSSSVDNTYSMALEEDAEEYWVDSINEFTDEQYPNNPDISIRSKLDGSFSHSKIKFVKEEKGYSIYVLPNNDKSDTVVFPSVQLSKFIPSVPTHASKNEYLTHVAIVNQEWNRMQVNFKENQFHILGKNLESEKVTRIDISRNCINAYLWELIFYTTEEGKTKPIYHGWFNFPKDFYAKLFEEKNNLLYSKFKSELEEWVLLESKPIEWSTLREKINSKEVVFNNMNQQYYPEVGERKKKKVNIMAPKDFTKIQDFLTDSTVFATFSKPGYYDQSSPRKTQLGLLSNLDKIMLNTTISNNSARDTLSEIVLYFANETDSILFTVGGINLKTLPVLDMEDSKNGYQMPMGIGNYSFYSNYSYLEKTDPLESPYYSFITDSKYNWKDSHGIGTDGPLLHLDKDNKLHFWILSFERHCFVGHYVIDL